MDQEKIGAFICELRKERQMTQLELAKQLNVTDKAVSKWERGLSYPDITILTALADIFGVTERDLLLGQRHEPPIPEPSSPEGLVSELLVKDTLEYAKQAEHQHRARAATVFMTLYTLALAVAAFVCALCDVLVFGSFTWSTIVLTACGLAWVGVAPFYYCKRGRLLTSLAGVSLFTALLLWVIQRVTPESGSWYPWPAMAILGVCLLWAWIPVLLHTFTPINKWHLGGIAFFLAIPLNWCLNALSNGVSLLAPQNAAPLQLFSNVSSTLVLIAIGLVFFRLGRKGK